MNQVNTVGHFAAESCEGERLRVFIEGISLHKGVGIVPQWFSFLPE
ncbi:hypothetical protein WDW86_03640 [Bdellovibrionota bacterium FG-2]